MRSDDIQLAIDITKDRNPYRLASWLSTYRGHWSSFDMAEIREALGMANEIDADVAVAAGIGGVIEPDKRRGPRIVTRPRLITQPRQKVKIDEELQALPDSEVAQMEQGSGH